MELAGPSDPAVISGWDGVPTAGDTLVVVPDESSAKDLAEARRRLSREKTGEHRHSYDIHVYNWFRSVIELFLE